MTENLRSHEPPPKPGELGYHRHQLEAFNKAQAKRVLRRKRIGLTIAVIIGVPIAVVVWFLLPPQAQWWVVVVGGVLIPA
jgi:hypothetical protein